MVEQPPPGEPAPTDQPPGETPPEQFEPDESVDPFDQETEPTAWYRKPAVLIGWALLVLILIALIVYGLTELLGGQQGTSHVPSTSTTPPTSATTTTTPPTATSTTTPPTSSAVEPPAQQPTQQQPTQQQPTQQEPSHRHHLPQLPPVITIPGGPTMTVPPPLR